MAYNIKVSEFSGPMDLLLHLIEKAKIDIKDIFISEITEQYLAYMAQLDVLDMEIASEFAAMAATLILIKSKSLLPRPQIIQDDMDDEQRLIIQIREYKAFKEASEKLVLLAKEAEGIYGKLPEEYAFPPPIVNFNPVSIDVLRQAFLGVLSRIDSQAVITHERQYERDEFSISGCMDELRSILKEYDSICFNEIFKGNRMHVIVAFMAILEMIANGEIGLKQDSHYSEITIFAL